MVNNFILVVFLFLVLNILSSVFSLSVADFEPVNASWAVPFEIILR